MAISNNYAYTVTKQSLIKDALIEAGVITDDQEVDGAMYAWMSRRLNGLLKQLQAKGLHLWKTQKVTLLLDKDRIEYTIGVGSDSVCAEDLIRTTLTASVAVATTTYSVDSTGMTVGDYIGIEQTDGILYWQPIATIPDSSSVTVPVGPTSPANDNATVYSYTNVIPKPLRVHEAYVIQKDSENSHLPIRVVPREEYMRLNSKNTGGVVVELYFNPNRGNSVIKVWPTSTDNIQRVVMTVELPIANMDKTTDDLEFPDWWFEAIHLKLAHSASRAYRAPIDKVRELKSDAKEAVKDAEDFNVENTYIEMQPAVKWV